MIQHEDDKKKDDKDKSDKISKPDPETTHTTDPQEHMKGPISSLMQGIKDGAEENDKESKEEADEKKKDRI